MLAFLSGLVGFASSIIPELVNMMKDRRNHQDEMAELRTRAELGLKQAEAENDTQITKTESDLYTAAQDSFRAELLAANDSWIGVYSATVRPTITYAFFLLYTLVKVKIFFLAADTLPDNAMPWQINDSLLQVWTENDMMMLSWIIGFWFGNRALRKK